MKSRVRRIGALIFGVLIASVLLVSLHQLSSTEAAPPTFDPTSSILLSTTTAFANPDHTTVFNVPSGDLNFAGSGAALLTFLPAQWCIATHSNDCSSTDGSGNPTGPPVPTGVLTGTLGSFTSLGLTPVPPSSSGLDTACNQSLPVRFGTTGAGGGVPLDAPPGFVEAVPDDGGSGPSAPPYDVAGKTIAPTTLGNNLEVLAEDADNNGIADYADLWPTYNSELLDPDGPGAATPVFPIARYAADTLVTSTDVVLQTLVFAPGALLAFPGQPWQDFSAVLGYPVLTILQNPLEANNTTIADFCSPLTTKTLVLGTTITNTFSCRLCSASPNISGGQVLHENDSATSGIGDTGTHLYRLIAQGGRDLDQDSFENAFDTCATLANLDGDPRTTLGPDLDGLDSACDPDTVTVCSLPCDQDNDGWSNRLDNCPLVANVLQVDADVTPGLVVTDGGSPFDDIGDACEPDYNGNAVADPEESTLSPTAANGGYLDAVVKSFACNGSPDTDGDGWCNDRETFSGTLLNDDCAQAGEDAVPVDNNNDGAVNIGDRAAIVAEIIAGTNGARFDLDSNGFVNNRDRAATVISNGWTCT